jgi:predicted nucleic acid-binding protein
VVVLDSSFLVGYHNRRDVHHAAAAQAMERLVAGEWGRALLLEYVFVEVATVLLARLGLETASSVATALIESREIDFVPCSDIFLESLEAFRRQQSGVLSFTDAAIVAVAAKQPEALVATFDTDFGQVEGITVVPG